MTAPTPGNIRSLLREANQLPSGEAQYRVAKEAVRLAEVLGDPEMLFDARMLFVRASCFACYPDEMLVAFAWCVARYRAEPERFSRHQFSLLWAFKYATNEAPELSEISREQIERILAQMAEAYSAHNYNMRTVYYQQFRVALSLGDIDRAAELYPRWTAMQRDRLSDCFACEADTQVRFRIAQQDYAGAIDEAAPILEGKRKCESVPHRTFARMLRPLALLGRHDQARDLQRRGYRIIRSDSEHLSLVAEHIAFLTHDGNLRRAIALFERHLPWAMETDQGGRLHFSGAAFALFSRMAEQSDRSRKLRIDRRFELYSPDDSYQPAKLAEWFSADFRPIVEEFDLRNGNDSCARELAEYRY